MLQHRFRSREAALRASSRPASSLLASRSLATDDQAGRGSRQSSSRPASPAASARARSTTGRPGHPSSRSWLARLDHAGIYLLIAGTYTPFGLLVFSQNWAILVLSIVYTGVRSRS